MFSLNKLHGLNAEFPSKLFGILDLIFMIADAALLVHPRHGQALGIPSNLHTFLPSPRQLPQLLQQMRQSVLRAGSKHLRVDGHEALTEIGHLLCGLPRADVRPVVTAAKHSAQNFDHRCQAVAFVARVALLAAQGHQGRRLEGLLRVRGYLARLVHGPARGYGLFLAIGQLDLAQGHGRGRHVQDELVATAGAHAQGQRVRAEGALGAAGGCHQGAGVGAAEADHALLDSHEGVVAADAVVVRAPGTDQAHAELPGLVDRQLHAILSHDLAQPVAAVHQGDCLWRKGLN